MFTRTGYAGSGAFSRCTATRMVMTGHRREDKHSTSHHSSPVDKFEDIASKLMQASNIATGPAIAGITSSLRLLRLRQRKFADRLLWPQVTRRLPPKTRLARIVVITKSVLYSEQMRCASGTEVYTRKLSKSRSREETPSSLKQNWCTAH